MEAVDLDGGRGGGGKGSLGPLAGSAKASHGPRVVTRIYLGLALEFSHKVFHQSLIEVLSTQMGVAGGRLDLEYTFVDGEKGNVEGPSPEIENEYICLLVLLSAQSVGNGCCGGFIDDAKDVESGNSACVLGRLPLLIVEIGGDCDHSVLHLFSEVLLRSLLHLSEDHR
mmetsp:Transcript_20688/g.29092  ORF Transcript_20688/g.29092 Transcript_20688/m.29092 type:complete len:169 (-) Transcript_20688:176-682(-)